MDNFSLRLRHARQSKGNIPYFETSAKEAINVEQAFQASALPVQRRPLPPSLLSVPNYPRIKRRLVARNYSVLLCYCAVRA